MHTVPITNRAEALERTGEFLRVDPVRHNMVLTLLTTRTTPSRVIIAEQDGQVLGTAYIDIESGRIALSNMTAEVARTLASDFAGTITNADVFGPVLAATAFVSAWSQHANTYANPTMSQLLYEFTHPQPLSAAAGGFRLATNDDLDTLATFGHQFDIDTGQAERPPEKVRDYTKRYIDDRRFFVWEDAGTIVSMCASTEPVAGVSRIQSVFTPTEFRGHGYAASCVGAASSNLRATDQRVCLYADLGNATSNALYRRLGYRVVEDCIDYRVGMPRAAT